MKINKKYYNTMNNNTQNGLLTLLYKEIKEDRIVDSWFLVNSPWSVCIIVAVYLTIVLKLGPKLMEKREPYNLKYIIMAYNLIQVLSNGYILAFVILIPGGTKYSLTYTCHPDNTESSNHIILEFHKAAWLFALTKILDLLDTLFIILRKKQSQLSFLHVYHHAMVVITCFFHLRFIKDVNVLIVIFYLNAFVHVIMYNYYFLSILGPSMEKYLWWKKYLTLLQIIQFIISISYWIGLVLFNCTYPKLFVYYMLANISLFLYLFLKFYKNKYEVKNKTQ